jgi:DNA-binding ferritin-like protein
MVEAKDEELVHLKKQIDEMAEKIKSVFTENVDLKRELMNSEQKVKTAIESELNMRKIIESYNGKYTQVRIQAHFNNQSLIFS